MNENNKNGNFWMGFFMGVILGGIIIFLAGTKKGKKLLEKLLDQAEIYEEELEEKLENLNKRGEEFLKEAQAVKDKVIHEVDSDKKVLSSTLISKMDQTLSKIEDIQKKGVALTEDVHHRYFRKNGKSLTS